MRRLIFALAIVGMCASMRSFAADGEKYALLIGVGDYPDYSGLKKLPFAESDMKALAQAFEESGFDPINVHSLILSEKGAELERPSRENIARELDSFLKYKRRSDLVVVVFSGHGMQFSGEDSVYFCPSDARKSAGSDALDKASLLDFGEVHRKLEACGAGDKLLIADIGRGDPVVESRSLLPRLLTPPQSVAALYSCGANQKSFDDERNLHSGVFVHYLIQGLRGDAAEDNVVTVELLESYLQSKVYNHVLKYFKNEQRPETRMALKRPIVLSTNATHRTRPNADTAALDPAKIEPAKIEPAKIEPVKPDIVKKDSPAEDWNAKGTELYGQAQAIMATDKEKARVLFAQSSDAFRLGGSRKDLAFSTVWQGYYTMPDQNPVSGNWAAAIAIFEESAKLFKEVDIPKEYAKCLQQLAWCQEPDNNPAGSWQKSADFAAEAAKIHGEIGEKAERARSLHQEGWSLQPDHNPAGSWPKCIDLYEEAAAIRGELGDKRDQGISLHNQAYCLIRGEKQNMTRQARELFKKAAEVKRAAGDIQSAETSEAWLKE